MTFFEKLSNKLRENEELTDILVFDVLKNKIFIRETRIWQAEDKIIGEIVFLTFFLFPRSLFEWTKLREMAKNQEKNGLTKKIQLNDLTKKSKENEERN